MLPVVGPFLLLGIVAWVAAIAIGVGGWLGLAPWRDRWAVGGALAGFGTFELFLYAHDGLLPVLVSSATMAFPATAAVFVGCGVAAAYGTLFVPAALARPRLRDGTAEETLWLHDAVDRLRPTPGDWGLTALLSLPAGAMLWMGSTITPSPELLLFGAVGLLGPLWAGVGLRLRHRLSDRYVAELAARGPGSDVTRA